MHDRDECIEILADLVAARTENPPGDESRAAVVVAQYFEKYGIPYRTYEKVPGRANIIGTAGSGHPVTIVASHLDTVPAGEGWTGSPFELRVEEGMAYGRGACDNKAPMAASIIAAKRLVARGKGFRGTALIAGIADEEMGNEFGAKYLLHEAGIKADYAIVPDSSSHMRELDVAEKGAVWVTVVAHGRAAHGSRPWEGRNAIAHMSELVRALSAGRVPSPPHAGFGPATMNIGKISGGTAVNAVPDTCRVELDFRILPGTRDEDIYAFVEKCMAEAVRVYPEAKFTLEKRPSMPPHEIALNSRVVHAAQEASRRVFSRELTPLYQGGITLAKEFTQAGIPAIALGPGTPGAAHTANEWIEIDEMMAFADFLVEALEILGMD